MSSSTIITVLGDSHAAFFLPTPYYIGRLGLRTPLRYVIEGEAVPAASVAGFRPGVSALNVKNKITEKLPTADYLILAFGQVDLELGYYYRLAVKGESVTPESYVDWLLAVYTAFVEDLPATRCRIALKGVNLTALAPRSFAERYISRIVTEGKNLEPSEGDALVRPFVLSEDAQNAMHLNFNAGVRAFAERSGRGYFDLVADTGNGGGSWLLGRPLRLDDQFRTAGFDHHLANTVSVRRMHYVAAGRVFGLL